MSDLETELKEEEVYVVGDDMMGVDSDHKIIRMDGSVNTLIFVDPFVDIRICEMRTSWYKPYKHYFMNFKNGDDWFRLGFEWVDKNLIVACFKSKECKCINKKNIDRDLLNERINMVIGMTNYSLPYRNCEHIARFIYDGIWFCSQIKNLHGWLGMMMNLDDTKVDLFPGFNPLPIYPELKSNTILQFVQKFKFRASIPKESRNIVFFGPTGVGKSNLINHLSGVICCNSKRSPDSVTQVVEFIKCRSDRREFNLIDTIGVDHSYDWNMIFDLVKGRIGGGIPLFEAWLLVKIDDRLSDDNRRRIYDFYEWVRKQKKIQTHRVVFTHCRQTYVDKERERLKNEMLGVFTKLGMKDTRYALVDLWDSTSKESHRRRPDVAIRGNVMKWIQEISDDI